jgi:hypothetical protein
MRRNILALLLILFGGGHIASAQDPNFYIFICFGQSNMEGQGAIEAQDTTVDDRFQVFQAVDAPKLGRTRHHWYPATAPLCREGTKLGPADYFGRTLVANLPAKIKVGVINISVAGCKIELFQHASYKAYATTAPTWMEGIIKEYDGDPYQYLVDTARLAQKDGVIKGILLHQGESNTGDKQWPLKVKGIYDSLMTDLQLKPESVPLLAGEMVNADHQGACASMNTIIAQLPQTIPNSFVISSKGLDCWPDRTHFTAAAYREFGERYAQTMLPLLGYKVTELRYVHSPSPPSRQPTTQP